MYYDIKSIAVILGAQQLKFSTTCNQITYLLIDSRKVTSAKTSLFFALKGKQNDGHRYLLELYKQGLRNFVVTQTDIDLDFLQDANILLVKDATEALQQLAAFHRQQFNIPVIGITGSNGKTIVKEWLFQLLRERYSIVRSPKSYNSQVGVPLSVWGMMPENNLAIFEAGISQPGEMEKLEAIVRPGISIVINIGEAHAENFKDTRQKIHEKLTLCVNSHTVIYCKDYAEIHKYIQEQEIFKDKNLLTWSRKGNATLMISKIDKQEGQVLIKGIYKNDFRDIIIPFIDDASIENAIICWLVCLELGIEQDYISYHTPLLSPVAMRLELKEGVNNCSVINDSYNSDIGALNIALDFLLQQRQHIKRTVILSDILQSGKQNELLYRQVADLIHKKKVTRFIGIGQALMRQQHLFDVEKQFYQSTEDFLNNIKLASFRDEAILIKGARSFGFEEITRLLQQKAHETVLEINLNALIHNLGYFKSLLKPETKIMAMVKAFSYGSGSYEIASVLQFHNIDYLAVAYADEGIELRKSGIGLPIMVMNPEGQSFDTMIAHRLEPEIYSFRLLQQFAEALQRNDVQTPFPVHLEIDTGMHRLGFEKKEVSELVVRIKNYKSIKVQSVFSHFVGSDEHGLDYFSEKQIAEFEQMSTAIISHFDYPIIRHIANSAGISRFTHAQYDMVRLGIGLYGVSANQTEQGKLQQVSTLKTTISQVKQIKNGDTIGYSRKGQVFRDSRIATIPIGYADGLSRKLSNGEGKVLVKGKQVPIIGNVCMDMCMIDITDVIAQEGDEVILFGEGYPIQRLAQQAGTIAYEILSLVSRRVKRVYYQE